jgi:hypothetical protein
MAIARSPSVAVNPTVRERPKYFRGDPTVFTQACEVLNQLSALGESGRLPIHADYATSLTDTQLQAIFTSAPFPVPDFQSLRNEWNTVGIRAMHAIAPLRQRLSSAPVPDPHTTPPSFCYFTSGTHVGQWSEELDHHFPKDGPEWRDKIENQVRIRDNVDRLKSVPLCAPMSLLLQGWTTVYFISYEEIEVSPLDAEVFREVEARLSDEHSARLSARLFPPERVAQMMSENSDLDQQIAVCERAVVARSEQIEQAVAQDTEVVRLKAALHEIRQRVDRDQDLFQVVFREGVEALVTAATARGTSIDDLMKFQKKMTTHTFVKFKRKVFKRLGIDLTR